MADQFKHEVVIPVRIVSILAMASAAARSASYSFAPPTGARNPFQNVAALMPYEYWGVWFLVAAVVIIAGAGTGYLPLWTAGHAFSFLGCTILGFNSLAAFANVGFGWSSLWPLFLEAILNAYMVAFFGPKLQPYLPHRLKHT